MYQIILSFFLLRPKIHIKEKLAYKLYLTLFYLSSNALVYKMNKSYSILVSTSVSKRGCLCFRPKPRTTVTEAIVHRITDRIDMTGLRFLTCYSRKKRMTNFSNRFKCRNVSAYLRLKGLQEYYCVYFSVVFKSGCDTYNILEIWDRWNNSWILYVEKPPLFFNIIHEFFRLSFKISFYFNKTKQTAVRV